MRITRRSRLALNAAALAASVAALSASSWAEIPMTPVPITLQSFAVVMVGALGGWRHALVAISAWLALGAIGLPVLAGGASGLDRFDGATAGYLFAFPAAGMLMGWLVARGWGRGWRGLFAAALLAHAVCLGLGGAWLAATTGWPRALTGGVLPFLPGALIKSAAAALLLRILGRRVRRRG